MDQTELAQPSTEAALKIFDAKDVAGVPDGQRHCLRTTEDRAVIRSIAARETVKVFEAYEINCAMRIGDRADAAAMACSVKRGATQSLAQIDLDALAGIELPTLQLMRRTLAGRRNDSSFQHDQSDQLAAIDAEISTRTGRPLPQLTAQRQRDAQFTRQVAAARGAL